MGMIFTCNAQTPHFSFEELEQIYQQAETKETKCLRETARELFPGRNSVTYENLYIGAGPGRAFKHHSDEYEKPKWVLVSYPVMTGVMEDGTIYLF